MATTMTEAEMAVSVRGWEVGRVVAKALDRSRTLASGRME